MHTRLYNEAVELKKVSEMFSDLANIIPPSDESSTYMSAAASVGKRALVIMRMAEEAQKVQDGD